MSNELVSNLNELWYGTTPYGTLPAGGSIYYRGVVAPDGDVYVSDQTHIYRVAPQTTPG